MYENMLECIHTGAGLRRVQRDGEKEISREGEREKMPVCCARCVCGCSKEKLNEIISVELQMEKREEE